MVQRGASYTTSTVAGDELFPGTVPGPNLAKSRRSPRHKPHRQVRQHAVAHIVGSTKRIDESGRLTSTRAAAWSFARAINLDHSAPQLAAPSLACGTPNEGATEGEPMFSHVAVVLLLLLVGAGSAPAALVPAGFTQGDGSGGPVSPAGWHIENVQCPHVSTYLQQRGSDAGTARHRAGAEEAQQADPGVHINHCHVDLSDRPGTTRPSCPPTGSPP